LRLVVVMRGSERLERHTVCGVLLHGSSRHVCVCWYLGGFCVTGAGVGGRGVLLCFVE
jgi:hypothetical protein